MPRDLCTQDSTSSDTGAISTGWAFLNAVAGAMEQVLSGEILLEGMTSRDPGSSGTRTIGILAENSCLRNDSSARTPFRSPNRRKIDANLERGMKRPFYVLLLPLLMVFVISTSAWAARIGAFYTLKNDICTGGKINFENDYCLKGTRVVVRKGHRMQVLKMDNQGNVTEVRVFNSDGSLKGVLRCYLNCSKGECMTAGSM